LQLQCDRETIKKIDAFLHQHMASTTIDDVDFIRPSLPGRLLTNALLHEFSDFPQGNDVPVLVLQ